MPIESTEHVLHLVERELMTVVNVVDKLFVGLLVVGSFSFTTTTQGQSCSRRPLPFECHGVAFDFRDRNDAPSACVCVYYCSTYYKAVRGGVGGGGEWRTCATRDDEPKPVRTSVPIAH